jgi:hypothetical protein
MVSALQESLDTCDLAPSSGAPGKEVIEPLFERSNRGLTLISDQAFLDTILVDRPAAWVDSADLYSKLVSGILDSSGSDVILHRSRSPSRSIPELIDNYDRLSPNYRGRLQVIEAMPLEPILAQVDLFVSFASPALIQGCRSGLKPVQIGRALIDSGAFTHIFADVDAFVEAMATGTLKGHLSVAEYEQFEGFRHRLSGRSAAVARWTASHGLRYVSSLARDPIVQECRRPNCARVSPLGAIRSAIANPVAAWRLLRSS